MIAISALQHIWSTPFYSPNSWGTFRISWGLSPLLPLFSICIIISFPLILLAFYLRKSSKSASFHWSYIFLYFKNILETAFLFFFLSYNYLIVFILQTLLFEFAFAIFLHFIKHKYYFHNVFQNFFTCILSLNTLSVNLYSLHLKKSRLKLMCLNRQFIT